MHKLETRYLFYGSKVNLGSFGVIGVKFWFSLKMHYLFYVTKYIHVIHTLASHLQNKQGNWGQSGVDVSQPAGYAVCDGNMSSSSFILVYPAGDSGRVLFLTRFFFLSSFFLSFFFLLSGNTSFSHTSLHPILTKLGQSDRYLDHYSGTDNGGVRGHDGVTGVKKVIFIKKASSPTEYLALTRDLCICSSLTPSTKVMVLKNCQGSFGVTGVKSSFSQKRHQVLQIM